MNIKNILEKLRDIVIDELKKYDLALALNGVENLESIRKQIATNLLKKLVIPQQKSISTEGRVKGVSMDIKNIAKKRLKEYVEEIKYMPIPKSAYFNNPHYTGRVHKIINEYDISDIASQISSDIKKELKLIGSGKVDIQMAMSNPYGDEYTIGDTVLDLDEYRDKSINIYIEEIDE